MDKKHYDVRKFYGTTTLGEKGQVVIPAEARSNMHIAKGEKLLVFGMGGDMLVLNKLAHLQQFASHLETKLKKVRAIIKKTK